MCTRSDLYQYCDLFSLMVCQSQFRFLWEVLECRITANFKNTLFKSIIFIWCKNSHESITQMFCLFLSFAYVDVNESQLEAALALSGKKMDGKQVQILLANEKSEKTQEKTPKPKTDGKAKQCFSPKLCSYRPKTSSYIFTHSTYYIGLLVIGS